MAYDDWKAKNIADDSEKGMSPTMTDEERQQVQFAAQIRVIAQYLPIYGSPHITVLGRSYVLSVTTWNEITFAATSNNLVECAKLLTYRLENNAQRRPKD